MTIRITRPEIENLIQQRLQSGAFESVEDVIMDALETQSDLELWLADNRAFVEQKLARGMDQLDRGEGLTAAELQSQLDADRAAWLAYRLGH